jgi:pyruvate-ferredoxin/flavodoxin oxidoreductase
MTFADFAVQEARFRKHFRKAPADTWNENMVPLADFIELDEEEREDLFPYVWAVDKKNRSCGFSSPEKWSVRPKSASTSGEP